MKKNKKADLFCLISLYHHFTFQKLSLFIFLVSFVLITGILVLFSNPSLDLSTIEGNKRDIIMSYWNESFIVLQVFNSVLIAVISIMMLIEAVSFDSLFISYVSRHKLALVKVIAATIVVIVISTIEYLILLLISCLRYSFFEWDIKLIYPYLFLLLNMFFELGFSFLITTIISTIFTPIFIIFLFYSYRLIFNNLHTNVSFLFKYIPFIDTRYSTLVTMDAWLPTIFYSLIAFFLYISIYTVKDLKTK